VLDWILAASHRDPLARTEAPTWTTGFDRHNASECQPDCPGRNRLAITVVFTGGTFGMGRQPDRGVVPLGAGVPQSWLSNLGGISKIESIVWGDLPSCISRS